MFPGCGRYLVVLALVLVTSGHWVFLQTAAWIGMAVTYSTGSTLSAALEKTFDGKHPCKLCRLVKKGEQTERKQPMLKLDSALEFTLTAGTCGLFPPSPFRHCTPCPERADLRVEPPLLPPPRRA